MVPKHKDLCLNLFQSTVQISESDGSGWLPVVCRHEYIECREILARARHRMKCVNVRDHAALLPDFAIQHCFCSCELGREYRKCYQHMTLENASHYVHTLTISQHRL